MFLLPSIKKKSNEFGSELNHCGGNSADVQRFLRLCSRCGDIFELNFEDEKGDIFDYYDNIARSFTEYVNLEKRDPHNFEDFLLQYIEMSIEKNGNELLNADRDVDDSLCLECIEYLIREFKPLFNRNEANLIRYSDLRDVISREQGKEIESCDDENGHSTLGWFDNESNINLTKVVEDFIKDAGLGTKTEVPDDLEISGEDEKCGDKRDNKGVAEKEDEHKDIKAKDIIELRLHQNMELDLMHELRESENLRDGVKAHHDNLRSYLERLQSMDLLNSCFYIDSVDGIGRINSLRLCIDKNDFDNWNEINACFGLISLLLHCILEKHNLSVQIEPKGSYSVIHDPITNRVWPLFGSKFCSSDYNECISFDNGVSCLVKLIDVTFCSLVVTSTAATNKSSSSSCRDRDASTSRDSNENCRRLPFKYDQKENKIGGSSINLLFNDKSNWNRAMKMMLLNLKWLLVASCERSARSL